MPATPIARLRLLGLIEGTSTLVLFCIAMPIKYVEALGNHEEPVRIVGSIHGGLFLLYVAAALYCTLRHALPVKLLLLTVAAAVVPLGPFVIDHKLKRHEQQAAQG